MTQPAVKRIVAHHTTTREAGHVFDKTRPKMAAYTHLVLLSGEHVPMPTLEEIVAETRQTYSGPLAVAEDLMVFSIA